MEGAARSYLVAGIGVIGAGAIALAPVSPVVPADLQAAAAKAASQAQQVQLSAAVNPLEVYLDLFQTTGGNIGALVERVLESPAPILRQVLLNQLAIAEELLPALQAAGGAFFENLQTIAAPAIQDAFEAIAAGNFNAAANDVVTALFQPALFAALELLPALETAIQAPIQNMLAVSQQFQTITALGALGLLAPFSSSIYATGQALQNIADAASSGDLIGVAAAFIAAPGIVIGGFVNGFENNGGLLSDGLGTFSVLLQIRDLIAGAITPTAAASTAEATDLPSEDAVTVAVSTSTGEAAAENAVAGSEESAEGAGGTGGSGAVTDTEDGEETDVAEEETEESDVAEEEVDDTEADDADEAEDTEEVDNSEISDGAEDTGDSDDTNVKDGNKVAPGGTGGNATDDGAASGGDSSGTGTSDSNGDDGGSDTSGSDTGGSDSGGSDSDSGGDSE